MASPDSTFRAACVQMRSGVNPGANIDQATGLIREAAGLGASYVQTPEMSNSVNRDRDSMFANIALEQNDPMLAAFRDLARERRIHLHAGSLAILRPDGKVANRAFLIDPAGDIVARYDKIHLYDVDLPNGESWRESRTYTGGAIAVAADIPGVRLGLTICYDIRFPYLYRALAEAGAGLLTAPACFTRQTGEAHWVVLHRARAIETGSFMMSAAQAGRHEDGRETFGHSIIVDPWGRVLAETADQPGVIVAEIDPALVADARARIPTLQHTREFSVDVAGAAIAAPLGMTA
jgi:predicted amidohydrolase